MCGVLPMLLRYRDRILLWGQGVDSVNYPGPPNPIMSLKMYILLYIYVAYYGIN